MKALLRAAWFVVSGAVIAVGAGMVYLPAGLIVAGVEGVCGLYVVMYLEARRDEAA